MRNREWKHKQWDSFKLNVCVLNKFCIEMILDNVVLFLCLYKRETNTCEYVSLGCTKMVMMHFFSIFVRILKMHDFCINAISECVFEFKAKSSKLVIVFNSLVVTFPSTGRRQDWNTEEK